jgi:cytochrome P450
LKIEEIIPQSGVFLAAGHETTVTVLSHCIYEWSLRQDLQAKARESVLNVLNEFDGKFCYEAVQKMDYIEQCILGE